MNARVALAIFLVGVSTAPALAAERGSSRRDRLPADVLEAVADHADPEAVLRGFERALERRSLSLSSRGRSSAPSGALLNSRGAGIGPARPFADVPLASEPTRFEYRPTVIASRRNQNALVTAYVAAPIGGLDTLCYVKRSLDRGRTWSEPFALPMRDPVSQCSDSPALAYSADGKALLAAYREVNAGFVDLEPPPGVAEKVKVFQKHDVLVSRSLDDGRTWSAPVVAIEGDGYFYVDQLVGGAWVRVESDPGETLERPSLSTPCDSGGGDWAYVTATSLPFFQPATTRRSRILVARSENGARSFGPRVTVAESSAGFTGLVQGGKVAAGRRGSVIVAWYDALESPRVGTFEIRTRWSGDHGATWADATAAVANEQELGIRLGPTPALKTWWTGMFPELALDGLGRAHIVYAHDPEAGSLTAEEGDIRYATSSRAPYDDWETPVTVNDDGPGKAQGFPALALRRLGWFPIVEVVWEDSRLADVGNASYDIFHSRLLPFRWSSWSHNRRVSDASSTQDAGSTGERIGLAANHSNLVFAAWVDRRDEMLVTSSDDDVYGSRIAP